MSESDSCALFCQAHKKEKDNKDANKSYTYTYDSRGNLLSKKTYAFTLGTLGTVQSTASYGYATDSWKDRLTSYNGQTITYDSIGNPLTYNNGSAYTFTWEGRQMQTATKGNTTWTYTYNADGLRTGKTNGTTTYTYTWNENRQLSSMTWNTGYALFYYDADGIPYAVQNYDAILDVERTYLYVTNLQGDVLSIIDASSGATAVTYTYDAWGRLVGKDGTSSDYASIYEYNPLTYRGYIYDSETGFYYLQSRYYDPTIGRFLNADDTAFLGASGTLLGWNLFVYCENNPVSGFDYSGYFYISYKTLKRILDPISYLADAVKWVTGKSLWSTIQPIVVPILTYYVALLFAWVQGAPLIGQIVFCFIVVGAAIFAAEVAYAYYIMHTGIEITVKWVWFTPRISIKFR